MKKLSAMQIVVVLLVIVAVPVGAWRIYRWGYDDGVDRVHSYVKYTKGIMRAEIAELQRCCAAAKGE